jgi:hypothetical protein
MAPRRFDALEARPSGLWRAEQEQIEADARRKGQRRTSWALEIGRERSGSFLPTL